MTRSAAARAHAPDPTCSALGISIDVVAEGCAVLSMRVTEDMLNAHGIAHGGYLFLLADAAFSYACNAYGPVTVAQTAHVSFLNPARAGDVLVAEAVERTRIGRNGLYDVTVCSGTDLVAEFRGHSVALSGNPFRTTEPTH